MDVANTIYEVPLEFAAQDIDTVIIDALGLRGGRRNLRPWRDYVDRVISLGKNGRDRHRRQIQRTS